MVTPWQHKNENNNTDGGLPVVFHSELKGDVDFEKRSAKKAGTPWGTKELRTPTVW